MAVSKQDKRLIEYVFALSTFLKSVLAVIEIAGGIALLFINLPKLARWIINVENTQLIENPHDFVARYALRFVPHLNVATQYFFSIYLLVHGLIKAGLLYGIWLKKVQVYPIALAIFGLLLAYQVYQYFEQPSFFLILLSIFDVLYILLVYYEYKSFKARLMK